jgi:predicted deacylase
MNKSLLVLLIAFAIQQPAFADSFQVGTVEAQRGHKASEYPAITALQRMRKSLDPGELNGTIIMVHIADVPSFLGRTIYYNPVDGNELLRPYVYMPLTGETELDAAAKGLAIAFGLDHIVIDKAPLRSIDDSLYTDQTALVRGIPAITTETGQMGSNDDYWTDMAEAGIWNVLRHLQMIPGEEEINEGITWLTDYQVIRSPHSGIFQASVKDGYFISKGGRLGILVDFFGDEIEEIRAPFSGVVNYVVGTPPISEGEPVTMISRIQPDQARSSQTR